MVVLATERVRLKALRDEVEAALEAALPDAGDPPHRLHAAMRYALLSPGKRIRPLLALLTAEHLAGAGAAAMPGACALEMVHAASLVLDDLPCMDDADLRRGQPSAHKRYGEDVAVLTGVALLNEGFGLIARSAALPDSARVQMISLLARTVGTAGLVGGQERDLRGGADLSFSFLSELHHQKTGVLFIAAVEMGALAAGATPAVIERLREFAQELGLAFQALDDLQDEAEVAGGAANLVAVLGQEGSRREANVRLESAKAALRRAGPELEPLCAYVDLLMAAQTA